MHVCTYVCARTIGAMGLKFGTELGFKPWEVIANVWASRTSPPGRGRPKSASGGPCSPNRPLLGKLILKKVEEHPRYSGGGSGQIRSRTSPRGPSARGGSAAVVIGLIEPKLGRCVAHMGTCPQIYFGPICPQPAAPNPWPDCSGKRVRAPRGSSR